MDTEQNVKPLIKSMSYIDEIIVELLADELSMIEIAKEFGVSRCFIYAINSGKKHKMENFKYPIRELDGQIDENSERQKQKARAILYNMEPETTYTIHGFVPLDTGQGYEKTR